VWEVFRFDGAKITPVGSITDGGGTPNALPMRIPETPMAPGTKAPIPVRRR
jgi:hypothetical protein